MAGKTLILPAPYDHLPAASQPRMQTRMGEGPRLAQGHPACGARAGPWPGYFSTAPVLGWGASWQSGPGGHAGLGEDPPCLPGGQLPALWNAAAGQTQSFHPTWCRGERTAAGLFPFTERLLCPRPHFTASTHVRCLSECPQKPHAASPIFPTLHVRKQGSERLTLAQGPPLGRVIRNPQSARVLGCPTALPVHPRFPARVPETRA